MGLPSANVNWETRRGNMKMVCLNCHEQQWVDNFYTQYDSLVELYHDKFAKPGLALMEVAKPLLGQPEFSNKLDFAWYEIWHHEGRRARHGASMMGPDYTHWHGTYEVAKHFYTEMVPELRDLVQQGRESKVPAKVTAADVLSKKLEEILADREPSLVHQQDGSGGTGCSQETPGGVQQAISEVTGSELGLPQPPLIAAVAAVAAVSRFLSRHGTWGIVARACGGKDSREECVRERILARAAE